MALAEFPDARSGLEAGSRTFRVGIERSPIVRLATLLERERGRWFLWAPVLYGAGVAVYFGLATEPSIAAALVPLITALVLRVVFSRGTLTVVATGAAVGMALGFAAAKLRTEWVRAPVLERQLSGAAVRGWVELVEPRSGRGERITIRVHAISGISQERMPHRVRVTTSRAVPGLGPGVPVRLKATLSPPPIPALPGGYDFARTAYFMRLGGVGYALSAPTIDDQAAPAPLLLRASAAAARIRQAISHRVRAGLEGEQGAIADALITGERGGISDSTNAAYRGAGIFHILSISGLHMTIMAGAVFFAVRFLLAGIPAIALRYPIKKWAAVAATLAALGYLLISGGAFATVRSWLMITVMFLAVVMDRPAVTLRNVAVSALAILLVLPESLLDIGFQMSFAAVVALVASYEAIRTRVPGGQGGRPFGRVLVPLLFFGGIILSTVVASIAVAPFAVYHFHNSQQYAVIANLIAIPVCNIVVMPAALATMIAMPFGLEALPLWVMGLGIDAMTWCAHRVAGLPGAVARMPAVPASAFALTVLGGLWLCLWRTRWRMLGLTAIAGGVALSPTMAHPDILVGRDGYLVAVRSASGRLAVLAGRGTRYELTRWLEHDGDGRPASEVAAVGGFRCDASGCTASSNGVLVAVARRPSALAEDCARAGLLVLTFARPRVCAREGPAIDPRDLKASGTHAVYIEKAAADQDGAAAAPVLRIVSVAEARGARPWSGAVQYGGGTDHSLGILKTLVAGWWAERISGMPGAGFAHKRPSRIGQFAAPFDLAEDAGMRRPEVEDQDEDDPR